MSTGSKCVPDRIFDLEALRKPLESLLERSWALSEPEKSSWNCSLDVLGHSWTPESPYNMNLAIMEWEAGEARECQALQEEQQTQPRQEKQDHMYAQPFFLGGHALGTRTRAARARSAV